jgi:hypothetical protein
MLLLSGFTFSVLSHVQDPYIARGLSQTVLVNGKDKLDLLLFSLPWYAPKSTDHQAIAVFVPMPSPNDLSDESNPRLATYWYHLDGSSS